MSKEQQKCDRAQKFARNLLKQKKEHEAEIKRLNGVSLSRVKVMTDYGDWKECTSRFMQDY